MSDSGFRNIAVIGAGTMGSGIAAQIANAGHQVLLLDLPARDGAEKSPAEMAIDRLLASDPPQLMHKRKQAGRIIAHDRRQGAARHMKAHDAGRKADRVIAAAGMTHL